MNNLFNRLLSCLCIADILFLVSNLLVIPFHFGLKVLCKGWYTVLCWPPPCPGGAPELHVPDPGEHVPLLPVRLHLHDHDHHHREVAGRLLPLLLPGDINTNVLFGLWLWSNKGKNRKNVLIKIPAKYLHTIIHIIWSENYCTANIFCWKCSVKI